MLQKLLHVTLCSCHLFFSLKSCKVCSDLASFNIFFYLKQSYFAKLITNVFPVKFIPKLRLVCSINFVTIKMTYGKGFITHAIIQTILWIWCRGRVPQGFSLLQLEDPGHDLQPWSIVQILIYLNHNYLTQQIQIHFQLVHGNILLAQLTILGQIKLQPRKPTHYSSCLPLMARQ